MSVIADVRHNQVKGYSRKYAIGYIANTHTINIETHRVII
jgi:hypothetical protein